MNSTFNEVVDYLYGLLPMYQRVGNAAIKKNLDNTLALCEILGNPHLKFESIHVAGTNGKGSSSHYLASVFQEAGYHTGLYTSPHLKSFTERIRLNGIPISEEYVVDFVNKIKPDMERIQPSFFELTVVMAFKYFADNKVDIAIVEVGLGGRLDSTNVISPLVSLITNIGNDHADMLGDTVEKITFEKAGIIKRNTPVVISEYQQDVADVFSKKSIELNAPISFASKEYHCEILDENPFRLSLDISKNGKVKYENIVTDLPGKYQLKNIPGVIKTLEILPEDKFSISESELRKGLGKVKTNTGLKGRWQVLQEKPLLICDTAHNEDGIREVAKSISSINYHQLHIIIGMLSDKDSIKALRLLPINAKYYFCEPDVPRKKPAEQLYADAKSIGLEGKIIKDVNEAIAIALKDAESDDLIYIGGSNFVVAEINDL
jgi:dihydrofolate synthase/folylpolyglutamate synthase